MIYYTINIKYKDQDFYLKFDKNMGIYAFLYPYPGLAESSRQCYLGKEEYEIIMHQISDLYSVHSEETNYTADSIVVRKFNLTYNNI